MCLPVAVCPLGVCCEHVSSWVLWSACACSGINTNLLAREERPGRWEPERASKAMKKATAGVGRRDRRDGPEKKGREIPRAEEGGGSDAEREVPPLSKTALRTGPSRPEEGR